MRALEKRRQKPIPLIEREPEEIRRELAAFFGVGLDAVRVTKAKLTDGRMVAYMRLVWTPCGYMPEKPKERRRRGRPKKEEAPPV